MKTRILTWSVNMAIAIFDLDLDLDLGLDPFAHLDTYVDDVEEFHG